MDKIEILESEIEDLKKMFASLATNADNSENGGENNNGQNSTPSESSNDWITLYDSADSEKCFLYPQGIFGSILEIEDFPDIAPYKELKFHYYGQSAVNLDYYIFDISDPRNRVLHLFQANDGFYYMYNFSISMQTKTDTNKRVLIFQNSVRIGFAANKYPTIANQKGTTQSRILKIEAR